VSLLGSKITKQSVWKSRGTSTWLLPSSGTTGRTKHIEVSFDLLERRLRLIADDYGSGDARLIQLFHPPPEPS